MAEFQRKAKVNVKEAIASIFHPVQTFQKYKSLIEERDSRMALVSQRIEAVEKRLLTERELYEQFERIGMDGVEYKKWYQNTLDAKLDLLLARGMLGHARQPVTKSSTFLKSPALQEQLAHLEKAEAYLGNAEKSLEIAEEKLGALKEKRHELAAIISRAKVNALLSQAGVEKAVRP